MVGDSDIKFKAPVYSETDSNCPPVSGYTIYEKDCTTLSSAFENSSDLMSTLSDEFLNAKLVN